MNFKIRVSASLKHFMFMVLLFMFLFVSLQAAQRNDNSSRKGASQPKTFQNVSFKKETNKVYMC